MRMSRKSPKTAMDFFDESHVKSLAATGKYPNLLNEIRIHQLTKDPFTRLFNLISSALGQSSQGDGNHEEKDDDRDVLDDLYRVKKHGRTKNSEAKDEQVEVDETEENKLAEAKDEGMPETPKSSKKSMDMK